MINREAVSSVTYKKIAPIRQVWTIWLNNRTAVFYRQSSYKGIYWMFTWRVYDEISRKELEKDESKE